MNYPVLLSEILRGIWCLEPRLVLSYAPFVASLLDGKEPTLDVKDIKSEVFAVTDSGNKSANFSDAPKGSIAVIPLKGVMRKNDGLCSYGTQSISEMVREAALNPNIDATILDTDTGGGTIDSVPPMLDAIQFSKSKKTPILTHADLCASAGYWVASETDMVIANNTISSEFGSIGVMVSWPDAKPFMEKLGYKFHTVYAPESTHKNLPFENALAGDYQALKDEVLSPLAKEFQKAIKNNRKDTLDTNVEGILNGKMFFASDAVKNGLADKIGNFDFAIKQAKKLAIQYQFSK